MSGKPARLNRRAFFLFLRCFRQPSPRLIHVREQTILPGSDLWVPLDPFGDVLRHLDVGRDEVAPSGPRIGQDHPLSGLAEGVHHRAERHLSHHQTSPITSSISLSSLRWKSANSVSHSSDVSFGKRGSRFRTSITRSIISVASIIASSLPAIRGNRTPESRPA